MARTGAWPVSDCSVRCARRDGPAGRSGFGWYVIVSVGLCAAACGGDGGVMQTTGITRSVAGRPGDRGSAGQGQAGRSALPPMDAGTDMASIGMPPTSGMGTGAGTNGGGASGTTSAAGAGGEPSSAGASGEANSASDRRCSDPDRLRCASSGDGSRELCRDGHWTITSACAEAEVCSGEGQCQPISKPCRGNAGQAVCEGVELHICNQDGTEVSQQTCASERQCQAGVAARACAPCSPGDYRCTDRALERCGDDGSAWSAQQTCDTAALCNARARACTSAACLAGQYSCTGDILRKCREDQTGFDDASSCARGTCSAEQGKCLACVPGSKGCDGERAQTCRVDGSGFESRACSGLTPYCAESSGECVQCTGETEGECGQPLLACRENYCSAATATCAQRLRPEGSSCPFLVIASGFCDRFGICNECLSDAHCRGVAARPYCNALTGLCSECRSDAQCDRANFEVCTLIGACALTAGCGNSQIDSGEECDPTAPNWSEDTCDLNSCQRRVYQPCSGGSCARAAIEQCTAAELCARACNSAADCPRFPSHSSECGSGRCYLPCSGSDDSGCPAGLICRTDLSPLQCGAR